jgi:hypothetical protein
MSIYVPTVDDWEAYFPERIKDKAEPTTPFGTPHSAADLINARFAEVAVTVTVDKVWPGLEALDDQNRIGNVRFSLGRWYIDDAAISRIDEHGGDYDIELDRLLETDWVSHMLGKNWMYDPTDFFDILEEARRLQYPEKDENWLNELMIEDVYATLSSGYQPFFPSRMIDGNRVYIVSHMKREQKRAFAEFLTNEGYSFTH